MTKERFLDTGSPGGLEDAPAAPKLEDTKAQKTAEEGVLSETETSNNRDLERERIEAIQTFKRAEDRIFGNNDDDDSEQAAKEEWGIQAVNEAKKKHKRPIKQKKNLLDDIDVSGGELGI